MMRNAAVGLLLALSLVACSKGGSGAVQQAQKDDPAEVGVGERLFLDTRFSQYFAAHAIDTNTALRPGDPVMDEVIAADGRNRPGPFKGEAMNCRQCHLVDDAIHADGDGMRTYADFAVRSPVPSRADRGDTATVTARNSPALVNASLPRANALLYHFDGEFTSLEQLVIGTMTGRNYGWLPDEYAQAIAHIAKVIREDNGTGALAIDGGGSYRRVLLGTDPSLPVAFRLPAPYRIDVTTASDDEIVAAVAKLVAAYVRQLEFSRNPKTGLNDGSPYDLFLQLNDLPRAPNEGESPADYAARLRAALNDGRKLKLVPNGTRSYQFHPGEKFEFADSELAGLRLFLDPAKADCVACHMPPDFTDFGLHNTGATQDEYDALHGAGSFAALAIPTLAQRNADPAPYLPATPAHPDYQGLFREAPRAEQALATDLGAWVTFANGDYASSQAPLHSVLCSSLTLASCDDDAAMLDAAIATFKTPGLRDLGHSAPYLHTGREATVEDVILFYQRNSVAARNGSVRNVDPKIADINIGDADVTPLTDFLRSLDEDYN
ncbi:cytochrome c peroxidase [Solimonas terrae]|uniref:Uncharacterized protein n=1 Tax=Solimonas terrae TaxID=1396819 RepID=A0A6M2BP60_9GAMM|nr:cytochrome c peroxidase [Solimonas terrae]NGY04396.1 hypothetical protein [Solimonas terrae]